MRTNYFMKLQSKCYYLVNKATAPFLAAMILIACNKEALDSDKSPVFAHNGKLLMETSATDGSVFVISDNTLQAGTQYSLKKFSTTGSIEWSRFVADETNPEDTSGFSLTVKGIFASADGCFAVIDSVDESNDFERFFIFRKYDNAGTLVAQVYDPLFFEDFHYLHGNALSDGSIIYMASYRSRVVSSNKYVMIANINNRGETLWRQFVKITQYPVGDAVIDYGRLKPTGDNGTIVLLNGIGAQSAYILKLDAHGNVIWQSENNTLVTADAPDGGLLPYFSDIIEDREGKIVMLGMKLEDAVNDIYVLKLDASGNEIWDTAYSYFGYDYGYSLIQIDNSDYILTGFTDRISNTEFEINLETSQMLIIRMTATGEIIWKREYAEAGAIGKLTAETNDGKLVSIGRKISYGNILNEDLIVIRTAANGELQ